MKIPINLLSNIFLAEILDLFNSNNSLKKLVFIFEHDLNKSKYIEDLEILNLHNYYESLLYKVNYFCREINLGKKINNIDFLTKN